MVTPKHILGTFDEALASLRNNVLMMSSLAERSLGNAFGGLFQRDDDLCALAIADQAVNTARKARKLNHHPALPEMQVIEPIYQHALAMFRDGVDSYARED